MGKENWKNGDGLIEALKATALADETFFRGSNKVTGGNLTPKNLQAAQAVASMVFPPAVVVIEDGQILMNSGGVVLNITDDG